MKFVEDKIRSKIISLDIKYIDLEGNEKVGTIEVNERIKDLTIKVFDELYKIGFPINSIEKANGRPDSELISNNITTSFNFRTVAGTKRLSKHAFGLSIDINPKNNPAKPSSMAELYDESIPQGKINQEVIDIFKSNGFKWGGKIFGNFWDSHHFEVDFTLSEKALKKIYEES